jgi:acyl carrier protein
MMTYADILPQILETLSPYAKKVKQLQETTDLVSELGLDSLQVMQMLLKIED